MTLQQIWRQEPEQHSSFLHAWKALVVTLLSNPHDKL